jgi:hypothetical protein
LALSIAIVGDAGAGDQQRGFHRVSRTLVRFHVAKYSVGAAESWARSQGATEAEIENVRGCLPSGSVQTASAWK